MSTSKVALPAPFLVFGVIAIAFVAWVTSDALHGPAASRRRAETAPLSSADDPPANQIELRIQGLYIGQPQFCAQRQLTGFPSPEVEPIDLSGPKPVWRSRYKIHLLHPIPNLLLQRPEEFTPGLYTLIVEFDGGVSGHPISRIELAPAS